MDEVEDKFKHFGDGFHKKIEYLGMRVNYCG